MAVHSTYCIAWPTYKTTGTLESYLQIHPDQQCAAFMRQGFSTGYSTVGSAQHTQFPGGEPTRLGIFELDKLIQILFDDGITTSTKRVYTAGWKSYSMQSVLIIISLLPIAA